MNELAEPFLRDLEQPFQYGLVTSALARPPILPLLQRPDHHIEGRTISVIDCGYLPAPEAITFQPELALIVVKEAVAIAQAFESHMLDHMTLDAGRALRDGMEQRRIISQMGL